MADPNAPRLGEQSRDDLKHASEEARSAATSAAESAKARAGEAVHEAQARVAAEAERRQKAAGDEAGRLAEAFRAGREKLDDGSWQARLFGYAADATEELAHTIRDRSAGDAVSAISDFGRRNPAMFVGGMALMGFALSRVATASREPRYGRGGYAGDRTAYDPYGSRHEPGLHTAPLTPSAPAPSRSATASSYPSTPAGGLTASGGPSGTPLGGSTPGAPKPATPGLASASDPLSPSARPMGGVGETKREI